MSVKNKKKVALCPHCGHDEFAVNESEVRHVRLVSAEKPPYVKERKFPARARDTMRWFALNAAAI